MSASVRAPRSKVFHPSRRGEGAEGLRGWGEAVDPAGIALGGTAGCRYSHGNQGSRGQVKESGGGKREGERKVKRWNPPLLFPLRPIALRGPLMEEKQRWWRKRQQKAGKGRMKGKKNRER